MDTEPDPRLEAFDAASPNTQLRMVFLAILDMAAWMQQLEEAIAGEGVGLTAEEVLELFEPTGPEN